VERGSDLLACADQRSAWRLHDLCPNLEIPTGGPIAVHFPERLAGRLARTEATTRVGIAREVAMSTTVI
jgi:hypothetical protein